MASIILTTIGAAAGRSFLGSFGAAVFGKLGSWAGGAIDSALGLGSTASGPRLDNLSVQDSRYGAGIPIVYGNARIAGNVLWASDFIETKHTETAGGKGGGSVTTKTYSYSVHCAIGICAGPIEGIDTIWADSTVIYQNGIWTSGLFDGVTIYKGSDSQTPDPFMESILGSGNVPACKGLAYIVFDNLQLAEFGNRLPNLTFEISPAAATDGPISNTAISASISLKNQTVRNGTMLPIPVQSGGSEVQKVLIGGIVTGGSTATFIASEYDVTGSTPVAGSSVKSGTFAFTSPLTDSAWAMGPDGRFVACYAQTPRTISHNFVIFDAETRTFGTILTISLSNASTTKQIAWLDAQHFVIDDVQGGVRGLRVFARAGTSVVDLGFTGLWGTGSGTSTSLFYGAQFTPYADGLVAYALETSSKTLMARTIAWRNNQLALGTSYTVASIPIGTGSGPHARFVNTANNEWTLVWGTVLLFGALSFEPSATGATITRPAQNFTQSFGTGTTHFPLFFGDRLVIVQSGVNGNTYLLSEVLLNTGSFTLSVNAAAVSGLLNSYDAFCAVKLDGQRLLFIASGGSTYTLKKIAVFERSAPYSVAAILSDVLKRAGYMATDFDVSAVATQRVRGYVLQEPMSARKAIEPLQAYAAFDLIETGAQLKAVPRGGNMVASIPATERRAALAGKDAAALSVARAEELELPREVDVEVIDPSRNFEVNCQRARRLACSARSVEKLSLPVVCTADKAKQIAETRLFTAWAERELAKLSVSRRWAALDPGDVVDLGNEGLLRLSKVALADGIVTLEGYSTSSQSLSSSAAADSAGLEAGTADAVSTTLYLMDLPLLQSADNQPGVYVAATGVAGWKNASVMRSGDGVSYSPATTIQTPATAGIAASALGAGSAFYIDNANTVTVQLQHGTLSSCSFVEMTNGANAALLGDEIIQFQTATLVGPGLYTLGNLLRGRRGTEDALGTHALGERFVLLQAGAVTFLPNALSDRGKTFQFRAVSSGQTLSDAQDYAFVYGMKMLCPLSPADIGATRSLGTTGDLTVTWKRRARLNAEWVDDVDVPLDEDQELYELDVMNGDTVVRAFPGLTSASVTYTQAQQAADWEGSVPSSFTVNIWQVSARVGPGNAATAVV
ncbi:MAG: phage tail protein [Alphaproteobacteria bacterium]|nr:phage tail protein [Alphaproteobacteria bacterium]